MFNQDMAAQLEEMLETMKPMLLKNAAFQAEAAWTFYKACVAQGFGEGATLELTVAFVRGAAGSTSGK